MSGILCLWEYNIERNPLEKKTVRKVWTKHYLAPWYKMSECMCPGYAPYMFEIKKERQFNTIVSMKCNETQSTHTSKNLRFDEILIVSFDSPCFPFDL